MISTEGLWDSQSVPRIHFMCTWGIRKLQGTGNTPLPNALSAGTTTLWYQYDQNGNIIRIGYNDYSSGTMASWADDFVYDERNQLIREDSQTQDKTFVYEYDEGGKPDGGERIRLHQGRSPVCAGKGRKPVPTAAPLEGPAPGMERRSAMTYDAVGNMLTRGDISYTWTRGRKLFRGKQWEGDPLFL